MYLYIGIGYILPTIGSVRGFCAPRNVHLVIYIFALDICCQHLGNIRQLEGFCAPFGRKVKECKCCNIYIYRYISIDTYIFIGYMLPTFGDHMSVEFIHYSRAELSGVQLSTFFRAGTGRVTQVATGRYVQPPMVACNWEGRTQAFSWDQLCCMVDLLCHSYSI